MQGWLRDSGGCTGVAADQVLKQRIVLVPVAVELLQKHVKTCTSCAVLPLRDGMFPLDRVAVSEGGLEAVKLDKTAMAAGTIPTSRSGAAGISASNSECRYSERRDKEYSLIVLCNEIVLSNEDGGPM